MVPFSIFLRSTGSMFQVDDIMTKKVGNLEQGSLRKNKKPGDAKRKDKGDLHACWKIGVHHQGLNLRVCLSEWL